MKWKKKKAKSNVAFFCEKYIHRVLKENSVSLKGGTSSRKNREEQRTSYYIYIIIIIIIIIKEMNK